MLKKSRNLAAFTAALLATATAATPAAAQTNETWYAQGGYEDNSPYPPYPYGDNPGSDPYGQSYDQTYGDQSYGEQGYSQYGYGDPNLDPNYGQGDGQDYDYGGQYDPAYGEGDYSYDAAAAERDQAAQAWRDRYTAPQPGYNYQASGAGYGQQGYAYTNEPVYGYDQQGYGQSDAYRQSYNDYDYYRRECERQRANNQIGGLAFGAIAGGLFGNAVSRRGNRGGATAAGAIMGGALGLAIGSNLDCDDGYYAQTAYYGGFEAGYPHRTYRWNNPRTGSYGAMRVGEYYRDPYGQRCATYSQTIWVRGRPEEATGYACRRYDGTWEIIS